MSQQAQQPPPVQEKTEQQLLEEKKQRQQQQRQRQEQRKRLEQEARLKRQEDMKKLQEALKGALSGLSKTADNRSVAYAKLVIAEKQIQKLFPSILAYKQIRYLDLNTNAISDIQICRQFDNLVSLNISKNQLASLQVFNTNKWQTLQFLNISGNKIKSLSKITLPELRRLNLTENQISTVTDWNGHDNIEILELRKNKLRKLAGIKNMKNLKQCYVCENQLTDIRGIQNVPNLEKLSLRNNKIKTFMSPFPHLPNLKHLNVRENQIGSIKQLHKLSLNIKSINFLANPLADQLGQNTKKEVIFQLPHFLKINKSQVTIEDRVQFHKLWLEREAEKQKQRLEKLAQQEQARKAAQENAQKAQ